MSDYEGRKVKMECSPSKPCYCHENTCLVSDQDNCARGNVFIQGTSFCGPPGPRYGWSKELGKLICRELGFEDVERLTDDGE